MTLTTKSCRLLLWAVVFVFAGADTANAQTAQDIARKAFSSTVLLVMEDANGQPLSLGSGFFVGAGQIASNLHVVEGAVRGSAKLVGQKTKHDLEGIVAVDPERDLVVLKIAVAGGPVLALGNSDAVQVGESVYAVGNPQGLEGTFSQGVVSSIREVGIDQILQITAPISPGSSGGPVLNSKGAVIGVSVATFRGGQNLNFAIPSNYLKTLLEKAGPPKPLAQARPTMLPEVDTDQSRNRDSEAERLSIGLQADAVPYLLNGYNVAVWTGRDRLRFLGFLESLSTPEVLLRDGFQNGEVDISYGFLVDYFLEKNFQGLWVSSGFGYFGGTVGHESELTTGEVENIVFTVGLGYVLPLGNGFYFSSIFSANFIIGGDKVIRVGSKTFYLDDATPDLGVQLGWAY